jgi:hypothetical protein
MIGVVQHGDFNAALLKEGSQKVAQVGVVVDH